jgi:glycosyltransferase involved in cell wall biosynthesis
MHRLRFVAPSQWLVRCIRERFGGDVIAECIPNTVDLDVFKPVPMAAARQALGLPEEIRILLVGAQAVDDERKGARYLSAAVQTLHDQGRNDTMVLAFGNRCSRGAVGGNWRFLGPILDERMLNLCYNAADVFVLPSLADNLPNTLVEAVAAGTPSVTFDTGGCPEVVRDGETGFVARCGDSANLAACIERVLALGPEERLALRQSCRKVAEREYALNFQAEKYARLFEDLLRSRPLAKATRWKSAE